MKNLQKNLIKLDFKINHATKKQTYRSSRVGTVHADIEELKRKLGEPYDCTKSGEWESRDNKVRVEWAFIINNDKNFIFTIYDYKSRYPLEQIKQWSLGGKNLKIKNLLSKILTIE